MKNFLNKSWSAFAMVIIFTVSIMNSQAKQLPSKAVYDMEKGGTQYFVIHSKDDSVSEIIIEEIMSSLKTENGKYKVSYKNIGAWEAGFYVEIVDNKIVNAYSPFHSVAIGKILQAKLTRNNTESATYSFIYNQFAINYSTGVVARISDKNLIVGQKE